MTLQLDTCLLCDSHDTATFSSDKNRDYLQCTVCNLVFVPKQFYLNPEQEKAEYDLHENNPNDSGYRSFLSRIFEPVNEQLSSPSHGLDFGCGPGPTLSVMFKEAGHSMNIFDIYYYNDNSVFTNSYDFVTASEVFEHLSNPLEEIKKLWSVLKNGGILAIMTKRVINRERFKGWHYKNDKTHIIFFSEETFKFIANMINAECRFPTADVCILQKK